MEGEFLSNVGRIEDATVRKIIEDVRTTGMQIVLNPEWDAFSVGPERVMVENDGLARRIYENTRAIIGWMIASQVLARVPCDGDWFDILATSIEASPDLNDKYTGHITGLAAACQRADLESVKQHARRAVTCWDAMSSQHKRIMELPNGTH